MSSDAINDPNEEFTAAVELTKQGRYEEALQKHLWYHDHAVQYDPSLSGVRLSFALNEWALLGDLYPPAREALIEVRDRKATIIRDGNGFPALLSDVSSINSYLKQEGETVDLFLLLHRSQPHLASRWYREAEEALIACREYRVCSSYIPNALERFETIRHHRRAILDIARAHKTHQEGLRQTAEESFEKEVVSLIHVLAGNHRNEEADIIRDLARAECGHEIVCSDSQDEATGCTCGRRQADNNPSSSPKSLPE